MKLDVLTNIRSSVEKALAQGQSFNSFKKDLVPNLQKLGWWGRDVEVVDPESGETRNIDVNNYRLKTIYQTNLQSSYMAGRYSAQMEDDNVEYLRYSAILDGKTSPEHRAMNGTILPKNHPWWDVNYPPNRWNCRCSAEAVTAARMERNGWTPAEKAPPNIANPAFQGNGAKDAFNFDQMKNKDFKASPNQPNFQKFGRLPSKEVTDRLTSPDKTPLISSVGRDEIQKLAEKILGIDSKTGISIFDTADGDKVVFTKKNIEHLFVKADGRERFLNYVLPTLQQPYEVWLTQYEWKAPNGVTYKQLRKTYVGMFKDEKNEDFVSFLIKGRDGSVFWNAFPRNNKLDKLRTGMALIYPK